MLKFGMLMLIPIWIFIYTISFGRWLHRKREWMGASSVYLLAAGSVTLSSFVLWKLFI